MQTESGELVQSAKRMLSTEFTEVGAQRSRKILAFDGIQLGEAATQVVLLDGIASEAEGACVRLGRFQYAAEPPQEIGARGVEQMIFVKLAGGFQGIDQGEASFCALTHRDGNREIEGDYWGR